APYSIDAVRSALVYERRSLSAAVTFFAGYGMEWSAGGVAPYVLAGVSIADRIVVRYRPERSPEDLESSLQIGWKLRF
ncbi:MAG TPA: hypothetical protein VK101_09540, partial [Limnochordia bacterium]|nr:hypothetical protein [Limnochordia bacterium]